MTISEEAIELFEKLDQEEKFTYLSRLSALVNMQKERAQDEDHD